MHLSHICGVPPEKVNVHCHIGMPSFHYNKLFVYSVSEFMVSSVNEFQKNNFKFLLIHFMPSVSFYTLRKHQKTSGFLMFSGSTEKDQRHEMS